MPYAIGEKDGLTRQTGKDTIKTGGKAMFIYTDNETARRAVKSAAAAHGLTLAALARKMGKSPQLLNDIFNKRNLSLADIDAMAAAIDCKLLFDIVPEDATRQSNTQDKM